MAVKRGEGDFPKVYRPCRMSEVYGQEKIGVGIKKMLDSGEVYHSFLLHGESGTGKTTIARVVAMGLLCRNAPTSEPCGECDSCRRIIWNQSELALFDFNAADFNNIDTIRDLRKNNFHTKPFNSDKQIFIFDECQRLTESAQAALLSEIETSPPHNYFIFCSTDPQKILKPLRNRCAQYEFKPLNREVINRLILDVCEIEKVLPDQKAFDGIIGIADGKPRNALILLQQKIAAGVLKRKSEAKIETLQGTNRLLVVAPHAAPGDINDDHTGIIARNIQSRLDCYAVINEKYSRDEIDLNDIGAIQKRPEIEAEFLHPIRTYKNEIKTKGVQPLIVYLHGIRDENIKKVLGPDAQILIGYGQGGTNRKKEYPNHPTISAEGVKILIEALASYGFRAEPAPVDSGYCAHDETNMNQLFNLKKHRNYHDSSVRSVQLEIRAEGLRNSAAKALLTSGLLGMALKKFIDRYVENKGAKTKPEMQIVDRSLAFLKEAFKKGIYSAKIEAGQHIIHSILNDDYELARNLKKAKKSNPTLKELVKRLDGQDGNTPSKTWFYDAVKLAVDERDFGGFHTYGMLGLSHKVLLTHLNAPEVKKQLAQKAIDEKWTVAKLRAEIAIEKEKIKKQEALLKAKKSKKQFGFQEWTESRDNVNICTGCENDCLYCYAKEGEYRRKRVEIGKWNQMVTRQHDVEKNHGVHGRLRGFPTSHDILSSNIDDYLKVLGRILRGGDEVLIVSKPRLECIQRICEAAQFFKDKILFRFTIGAMNDKVLSFWEPNAPRYKERKECLEYAFRQGFRTSVSMEPMLDISRIDALIKDVCQ